MSCDARVLADGTVAGVSRQGQGRIFSDDLILGITVPKIEIAETTACLQRPTETCFLTNSAYGYLNRSADQSAWAKRVSSCPVLGRRAGGVPPLHPLPVPALTPSGQGCTPPFGDHAEGVFLTQRIKP